MLRSKTYPVGSFLSNDVPLPKIKKKKIYRAWFIFLLFDLEKMSQLLIKI